MYQAHQEARLHYAAGQRVRVTSGDYRGRVGLVRLRYADPHGGDVLYEVRLDDGTLVVLPSVAVKATDGTDRYDVTSRGS